MATAGAPFPFTFLNYVNSQIHPSFLKIHNSGLAKISKRYLFMDLVSNFDIEVPEWWDETFTKYTLFGNGHFTVFDTDKFGVIPMNNSLYGMNVFYMPNKSIVANPLIESRDLVIGRDCVVVHLTDDYMGVFDLVEHYGDLMALTLEGIAVNILNSRLAHIAEAENAAHGESLKKLIDKILSGEPAVIERKRNAISSSNSGGSPFNLFLQNIGQNFVAPEMIESLQNIQSMFRSEIGISNLEVRKKERMLADEVNKGDEYSKTKAGAWIRNVRKGFAAAEKMFPELKGKLSIDFAMKEGDE